MFLDTTTKKKQRFLFKILIPLTFGWLTFARFISFQKVFVYGLILSTFYRPHVRLDTKIVDFLSTVTFFVFVHFRRWCWPMGKRKKTTDQQRRRERKKTNKTKQRFILLFSPGTLKVSALRSNADKTGSNHTRKPIPYVFFYSLYV